jgi:predicted nucleic acid-binding Zn ribbon protein
MNNMLKTSKPLKTSKVCPICKKKHTENWLYCSNECYTKADKKNQKESKLLKRMEDNIERAFAICEMRRALLQAQLEAENYPMPDYDEAKQDEREFNSMWYPIKMV